MDRREAVLRELNLYPQWKRRGEIAPATAQAESDSGLQQPAMGVAEPVLSADEGLNPSYEGSPIEGRLGGGEADTQQVRGIAEPVLSADEGLNPSCEGSPIGGRSGGGEADTRQMGAVQLASGADEATGDGVSDREQRIAELGWPELKTMVRDCTACKLRAGCTQTVFGVGDEQADWLFVGEGPGADEDVQGEPFVGQAGKLLDNMLMSIGLKRGNNVYIANVVKCRPPGNRTPEPDEIATCFPYLQRQIRLIQPKVIVALGKTAATTLLGRDAALGSLRGTAHDYQGIPLIVTYHPAYLLRSPLEKAKAWEDLCRAVQVYTAAA